MDAFEQFVRAGMELAGMEIDAVELNVMRAADTIYGPEIRALGEADLAEVWPEPNMDPGLPPAPVPGPAPSGA